MSPTERTLVVERVAKLEATSVEAFQNIGKRLDSQDTNTSRIFTAIEALKLQVACQQTSELVKEEHDRESRTDRLQVQRDNREERMSNEQESRTDRRGSKQFWRTTAVQIGLWTLSFMASSTFGGWLAIYLSKGH